MKLCAIGRLILKIHTICLVQLLVLIRSQQLFVNSKKLLVKKLSNNSKSVKLIGVEPAGFGIETGKHGAPLGHGAQGIFFGARSYNMQDNYGQIHESHSISAGLDFPSVGPEHAYLKDTGRAEYVSITDEEALSAFKELSVHEGIIPALESSHAVAQALKIARANPEKEMRIIANLSGRGDKDIFTVAKILEERGEF